MAQQTNIGKVSLTPRGAYSQSATYEALDIVTYNGSSYIVLQSATGITPPNDTYYQLIASKGDAGSNGISATISAGTVSMLPVGSNPSVTNAGTPNSAVFNFGIPYSPVPSSYVQRSELDDYVEKHEIDNAGISGESYSTVADTTTVTTSASQYHPNPYGTISSTTDLINLRNYYRITFNGVEYILPSQEWFINTSGGDFTYSTKGLSFIGNLSYFGNATGFYDTLYDVPFLISDAVLTGENTYAEGLYLFTNASTSATVKIELITYNFTKFPRVLLNGYSNLPIYQVVGSSFAESYNIGANNFPYRRGAVAIGRGNTVNTNNSCVLIGTGNEVSAKGGNAIGFRCAVSGEFSSAFGFATNASGSYSHSNGCHTTASGDFGASADGYKTTASGDYSSAIGYVSTASGNGSTASGIETTSSGNGSVSSGCQTLASGYFSNAKGYGSISKNRSQMAFGEFNIQDTSSSGRSKRGNFVEIVGNGTADDARSNARTLDWNGNESLAGSITLGMGTANEVTLTAQQLTQLLALLN